MIALPGLWYLVLNVRDRGAFTLAVAGRYRAPVAGGWVQVRTCCAIVVASALLTTLAIETGSAAKAAAASTPEWDARVRPIAAKVEQLRGLKFEHAVPIVFTTRRRFRRLVLEQGRQGLDSLGAKGIAREDTVMRALGLMKPAQSLESLQAQATDDVAAFYDWRTKRIVIRGRDVGLAAEPTIADELTHVLQDQHFDLERRLRGIPHP